MHERTLERASLDTLRYGMRCAKWRLNSALMRCPSCGSENATDIGRKAWVTDLVQCNGCRLLYRRPQEPEGFAERFYEKEYRSGLTTRLPQQETLATMLHRASRGDKASSKIEAHDAGVPTLGRILARSVVGLRRVAVEAPISG